jgi:hypothetical protein
LFVPFMDGTDVLARRVAINGFVLLTGSMFVGSHMLEFCTLPVCGSGRTGGHRVARGSCCTTAQSYLGPRPPLGAVRADCGRSVPGNGTE